MQNAAKIAEILGRMKADANTIESLAERGTPVHADALYMRAAIDGMASEVGEALENMPDMPTVATTTPKSINDFAPGDRVRLISINMRPMYLRGAEGTVEKLGPKKLKVRLDTNDKYRKYSGVITTCPVSICEKL
jgi:hypothetical protein